MTVKIMLADPQRKGPGGWGCDKHCNTASNIFAVVLSHALYSADLMAIRSCCLILTGRLSQSFVRGENQPLAETADPYLCSWGPSTPVRGRKLCFLRILSMAHSVAKSCDAGGTPPSPPTPAQERAHALFTLSGFRTGLALVNSKSSSSK